MDNIFIFILFDNRNIWKRRVKDNIALKTSIFNSFYFLSVEKYHIF
jgi:hypothetical protein